MATPTDELKRAATYLSTWTYDVDYKRSKLKAVAPICVELVEAELKRRKTKVYEYAGELISRCDCGEYIYFVDTDAGKSMPVSVRHHTSHFIDCPQRDRFRKGKK